MQHYIIVRKALIPHLFLPRVLPTEQCPELPLHESTLLRLFADVLVSPAFRHISALNCARQAFGTWADLQSGESLTTIDPQRLSATIRALRPGEHLPLLIREQNAGLIISVPTIGAPLNTANAESEAPFSKSRSGDVSYLPSGATESNSSLQNRRKLLLAEMQSATISTFPASLPNAAVLSAPTLTFEYPSSSVRVAFSPLLTCDSLAEQIALMHVTPISVAASKSHKAGKGFDEVWLEIAKA